MGRRTVLDEVGPFEDRFGIAADLEMWIRILRARPIGILGERLVRYRVSPSQWSATYDHMRTEEERFFTIMDHYLAMDGWRQRLDASDLTEYDFHRFDDAIKRAIAYALNGARLRASSLLKQKFPWASLTRPTSRKLRTLVTRELLRLTISHGGHRWMQPVIRRLDPGYAGSRRKGRPFRRRRKATGQARLDP